MIGKDGLTGNQRFYRKHRNEILESNKKPQNKINRNKNDIIRRMRVKKIIINHYSNGTMKCVCCGEIIFKFLTIDHINNDGAKHRREQKTGSGSRLYDWLIKHGFPEGFRVQCFNCNLGRAHNGGICPHEELGYSEGSV